MKDRVRTILDGVVGRFGPDASLPFDVDSSLPGYIKRGARDLLLIDAIDEKQGLGPRTDPTEEIPQYIAASTSEAGALVFDVAGMGGRQRGGSRVSTRTYRARGVVVGVPVQHLRSSSFYSLTAFFPGIGRWSAMSGSTEDRETDSDGLLTAVAYKLKAVPEQVVDIGFGLKLTLTTHWDTSGPEDRRVLYSPVSVSSASSRAKHWSTHLRPLLSVQRLVSLAYQGFVVADGGRASVDIAPDPRPAEHPVWWHNMLMERKPGAPEARSMTERPMFSLGDLGGIAGLRRWLRLEADYPRATGPLTLPFTLGTQVVETRLTEVAVALEHWVARHRRSGAWTKRGKNPAEAVALRVGKEFNTWVGDSHRWAKSFWSTYNGLKHKPQFQYDAYDVLHLADSGAVLLQFALLNRVAGTKTPGTVIFSSHRNRILGENVRSIVSQ